MILVYRSNYWYRVAGRRRKERVPNNSDYKSAMVNCVKYGLSSSILFFEVVVVILVSISHFHNRESCNDLESSPLNCLVINFVHHTMEYFILAWAMLPLCFVNMLCLFFIEVVAHSRVDIGILRCQGWKTFWLFTCTLVVGAVQNDVTYNIGVIITCVIEISLCWITCRSGRKLFKALKAKSLDYMYDPKELEYFTIQATDFKWSSLLVGLTCYSCIIANAFVRIHQSICRITMLIAYRKWHFSFDMMSQMESTPVYEYVRFPFYITDRVFTANWAVVSTLLNCFILVAFIQQALKHRRSMSKPFHMKLIPTDDGKYIHRRVNF